MKIYYTIIAILFFGLLSCSNEQTKTHNQVAARPTVPIQNGEVQIGTQKWMTKNLNVSRYRNGDLIPQVTDASQWAGLTHGAWCYSSNDLSNGRVYGKLYNWYAVNDPRGLAPMGWHVPNDGEWNVLINFLDGGFVAGWKLKETGTSHWQSPNTEATNSSGFTALPGGSRSISGIYGYIDQFGYFWSSSPSGETGAWFRVMNYYNGEAYRDSYLKTCGLSVRCVKD